MSTMEFDEIDEFEEKLEGREVQANLDLIDGLQKDKLAIDELLLRHRPVDDNYDCLTQKCNPSNDGRNFLRIKDKERNQTTTSGTWGHGCHCPQLDDCEENCPSDDLENIKKNNGTQTILRACEHSDERPQAPLVRQHA